MSISPRPEELPRLVKYELFEEIGHGGMATVYRARDLRLGREVAIKLIHRHLRESSEVAARFAAEARAVAKLHHPNIVEVYDVSDETDAEQYIVVELLRGTTLRKVLAEHREIPPEIGAAIGMVLASALAHAHAAGVIHRDLKPENVLVEVDDARGVIIKLTDFGIAKVLDAQGVTHTGQVLGSPAHMAPEQIEGGEVDARADVFGLGVLLYECLVGHLPFEGKNPAQVLRRVLEGVFPAADRERAVVGSRWAQILARALAKEPAGRFASADEFAAVMSDELTRLEITDPTREIGAFLADPVSYRDKHRAKMGALLPTLAQACARKGDVLGAAADWNRALAYAPNDPALLRQVARIQRGRAGRRMLLLALAIATGAVLVGWMAFAVTRALRRPPAAFTEIAKDSPSASALALPAKVEDEASPAQNAPVASASHRPANPTVQVLSHAPPKVEPSARRPVDEPPAPREVTLLIRPPGALVSIDGGGFEDWFGRRPKVLPGRHTFSAHVPNSKCCEDLTTTLDVKAGDDAEAQIIPLSLKFHNASVSAPGGPEGGRLRCPMLRIEGPASETFQVRMAEVQVKTSCDLESPMVPSHATSITLRAGELVTVPWPP